MDMPPRGESGLMLKHKTEYPLIYNLKDKYNFMLAVFIRTIVRYCPTHGILVTMN
uniref:Uncharacterized protein n=1 Tax=Dulem virus 42 TaxID=3145760 RepID=A0AAU8BAB8_9CAUD